MSQLSRVAKVLRKNSSYPGITAAKLAKLASIPKEDVYKRVYDLRVNEGHTIYNNFRKVRGTKQMFYRFAQ